MNITFLGELVQIRTPSGQLVMGQLILPRSNRPSVEIEPSSTASTAFLSSAPSTDVNDIGPLQSQFRSHSNLLIQSPPLKSVLIAKLSPHSSPLTTRLKALKRTESIGTNLNSQFQILYDIINNTFFPFRCNML